MSSRAGGLSDADAALELRRLLGDGEVELGRSRLASWLALGFLPAVPAGVRTSYALWRPAVGWTRVSGPITPSLLLGHFLGEWALGGVFAGEASIVVHDLDNQAGKRGDSSAVDVDLLVRAELVRCAQPAAVWLRSSASGGLHAWTFLDAPHPLRVLAHLPHDRLLRTATSFGEIAARLAAAGVGGVPGFLELLPQLFDQGGVIRAPLGPGSALLDDELRPLALSPGEAVARLVELASSRRVGLRDAFGLAPGPLPPLRAARAGPAGAPSPAKRPACVASSLAARDAPAGAGTRVDWIALLRRCDGRLPPRARPARHVYERVMRHLWEHGLPGVSTRHAATFLLALACRWQGLERDEAEARVIAWFEERGRRSSREWMRAPRAAERKTRDVVRHTYRERARRPARRRFHPRHARPGDVRLADQARIEALFPGDGLAIAVALRVLCWARTNARRLDTGRMLCEIPMRALGITTRRRRAAWQRVHDSEQVFRLYAARVPKRGEDHPCGPCAARAARYTILWRFAEGGPHIRRRARLSFRRVGYLAPVQRVVLDSASTVRRACSREMLNAPGPPETRPVGAVRAGAQKPVSASAPACKPLWETRSVFQGRVGGPVSVFYGPSTRPAAAAASTGPLASSLPDAQGGGHGGRGGRTYARARPPRDGLG